MMRLVYMLQVRAEPGVDAIRVLRTWLKIGLQSFGLKCVAIEQGNRRIEMTMDDMRKYGTHVIMPEDLHDGPLTEKAINIFEHPKHGIPVLEFESGNQLYLWPNLCRVLNKAWGYNGKDWIDQELELSLGHYTDKKTDPPTEKETIVLKPISPRKTGNVGAPSTSPSKPSSSGGPVSLRSAMDDEIPFAPEWR